MGRHAFAVLHRCGWEGKAGPPVGQDLQHHVRRGAWVARLNGQVHWQGAGLARAAVHAQHGLQQQPRPGATLWTEEQEGTARVPMLTIPMPHGLKGVAQSHRHAMLLLPGLRAASVGHSAPHLHIIRQGVHHARVMQLLHQLPGGTLRKKQPRVQ